MKGTPVPASPFPFPCDEFSGEHASLDPAAAGHSRPRAREVQLRERIHEYGGPRAGIALEPAGYGLDGRYDRGIRYPPFLIDRRAQKRSAVQRLSGREGSEGEQVAQRVGDERIITPFDGAQHVRAVPDHERGAGVDRRMREFDRITAAGSVE